MRVRFSVALGLSLALSAAACERDDGAAPTAKDPAAEPAEAAKSDEALDDCPGKKIDDATCSHEQTAAPSDGNHFGAAFQLTESEPLAAVAEKLGEGKKKVQVSGKVESVCQKKGCWMVLQDGSVKARIFTREHAFFLPRDITGKNAVVEGELEARTISEKFAKHLEEDKGGDPSKVQGEQRELVMNATSVALR